MIESKTMRQTLRVLGISVYIFFVLGFFFHTSPHPTIFSKYTTPYWIFLVFICVCIVPFTNLLKVLTTPPFTKKLLITGGIILLLIATAETIVRIKNITFRETPYTFSLNNFHPFLQGVLTHENNRENPQLHINTFGFRGDTITKVKPPHTYRIFILGGSTVLNAGIPYTQTFAKQLQTKLQQSYPDYHIEVLNAGMNGFTSEHSLIQYLFYIKDFQPDLIIMWSGINDMYYACQHTLTTKDIYKEDYSHELGSLASLLKTYYQEKETPISFHLHLQLVDLLHHTIMYNWYSDFNPQVNTALQQQVANPYKIVSVDFSQSLPSYGRNLQELIDILQHDHISLILGNQPYLYTLSQNNSRIPFQWYMQRTCLSHNTYPSTQSLITGIELFNTTTKNVADTNAVNFIDLASYFPKTREYFLDDVHLTVKGNIRTATLLFEYITSHNLLSGEGGI